MSPRTIRQKLNYAALPNGRAFEWAVFRANPITVELGVFRGGDVDDLADIASITVKGRSSLSSGTDIFSHTVESADFGEITSAAWTAGTAQHATFEISGANTNRAPAAEGFVALHVVITATTSEGEEITLGVGRLLVHEDNNGEDYPPEENAAGHQYLFGRLSESRRSVIFMDENDEDVGWAELNSGTAP